MACGQSLLGKGSMEPECMASFHNSGESGEGYHKRKHAWKHLDSGRGVKNYWGFREEFRNPKNERLSFFC